MPCINTQIIINNLYKCLCLKTQMHNKQETTHLSVWLDKTQQGSSTSSLQPIILVIARKIKSYNLNLKTTNLEMKV